MSELNIFAEQDRERAKEAERWGIADLEKPEQMVVKLHASRIISEQHITDDEEQLKVYADVKRQYLEHSETRDLSRKAMYEIKNDTDKPKDDTDDFKRGYDAFWKRLNDIEVYEASQYCQGYKVAEEEWLAKRRASKLSAIEPTESDSTSPMKGDPIREELQQLKEDYKALDERLKALEKYTQE